MFTEVAEERLAFERMLQERGFQVLSPVLEGRLQAGSVTRALGVLRFDGSSASDLGLFAKRLCSSEAKSARAGAPAYVGCLPP